MNSVFDIFNNTKINLPFTILKTDTLKIVKEKIFIAYDLDKIFITPEIMALHDGKDYIKSDENLNIESGDIIVYNLIRQITKYIFENIQDFLNITVNSKILEPLYNDLKIIYTNLTREYLLLSIQFILQFNLNITDFDREINSWIQKSKLLQQELIKKFSLLGKEPSFDKLKEYLFFDNDNHYIYSILTSIVSFKISDNKLDILKIIREYPLDKNVPVMITGNYPSYTPIIKIFKNFPIEQIEEWFVKSKRNDVVFKKPKGLTLKLLSSGNNYSTVIISKYAGKLSIRCSWSKEDKARLNNLKLCTYPLHSVIKKINNIFPSLDIKLSEPEISFINIQFNTKKKISFQKIILAIKYFKDIFKLDEHLKKKQFIKLKYLPNDITILIRYGNIYINHVFENVNSIDIIGIRTEKQVFSLIELTGQLLIKADKQKPTDIHGNILPEPIVKLKMPKANIKTLKFKGIEIDAIGCQKQRQPIISNTIKPHTDSYPITYKDNRFICNNEPYLYPGFTNKNIVCCFKKDQRDKDVYKRNMNVSTSTDSNISRHGILDADIINSKIITSDKILENNRLGLLPNIFYNFFNNVFYRLGVAQNRLSLLNVFNRALNKIISINDIIDYINNNPTTIKYLQKNTSINYELYKNDLINYIQTKYLHHEKLQNLLSVIFKVNIFIFNLDDNKLSCKDILHLPYTDVIFIINNTINYELIVSKVSNTNLKKVFSIKSDKIVTDIIDIYKRSCLTSFVGYPSPPMNFVQLLNSGDNVEILAQVINQFNNITFVLTKNTGLTPVAPSNPILNIPSINIKSAILKADKQLKLLLKSNIDYLKPIGQILDSKKMVSGIVTKSGLIIPTKPTKQLELPIVFRQFIDNIDELLYNQVPSLDKRYSYMLSVVFYKELYNRFKYTLSKLLNKSSNSELKKNIISSLKSIKNQKQLQNILFDVIHLILINEVVFIEHQLNPHPIPSTRNVCKNIPYQDCSSDPFCKKKNNSCLLAVEQKDYSNFIKNLSVEIIWNKDILSGNIKKEFLSKNNFIKRKNEIVLLTDEDINKLFKF